MSGPLHCRINNVGHIYGRINNVGPLQCRIKNVGPLHYRINNVGPLPVARKTYIEAGSIDYRGNQITYIYSTISEHKHSQIIVDEGIQTYIQENLVLPYRMKNVLWGWVAST